MKSQAISRQGYPATICIPGRDPSVVLSGNTAVPWTRSQTEYISLLPLISLSTKSINGYLRTARETRKCEKASHRSLLTKFSLWLNGVQLTLSIYSLYSLVEKHRKGKVGLESRLVNCLYTAQQRSNSWATFHFISPDEVLLIMPSAIQLLARNIILKLVIRD